MSKIYNNFLVILVLFWACFVSANQVNNKEAELAKLPSELFDIVEEPLSLSSTSVFYNQLMEPRTLENFDNRFIIVHFWSTWCMECKDELIALNNLQNSFRKKSLLVLAISEDFKSIADIDQYLIKHKIDYLDLYLDKKSKIYHGLEINYLPVSYLIDFDGKIIAKSKPGVKTDWSDPDLRKFLEAKVSQYQLLPPEFKSTREKYEAPVQEIKKETEKLKKTKSKIFIN